LWVVVAGTRLRRRNTLREFTTIVERDPESDWLVGLVAEPPGFYTQVPAIAALEENMREAKAVYRETLDEQEARGPFSTFVGLQRLEVAE
jgi:predicted RNase H-like HicB family nuclease